MYKFNVGDKVEPSWFVANAEKSEKGVVKSSKMCACGMPKYDILWDNGKSGRGVHEGTLKKVIETEFKVGDRVVKNDVEAFHGWAEIKPGDKGTVLKVRETELDVLFDNNGRHTTWIGKFKEFDKLVETPKPISFKDYQTLARKTANTNGRWRDRVCNWSMGLAGESGELVDLLKKVVFHGHDADKNVIKKELGDILWYVANIAQEFSINLEDVAETNIAKLQARYPEGFSTKASQQRSEYK